MAGSDNTTKSTFTSVDEGQMYPSSASTQKANKKNNTIHFDLISLAKLSTKVLIAVFVLVVTLLTFLLYLNDKETQEELIAAVDSTVLEKAFALDAEIYSIVKHIKIMKSVTDRRLAKSPDLRLIQTNKMEIGKAAVYHKKGDYSHLKKDTTIGSNEVLGSIIVNGKFNDQHWSRLKLILLGLDLFDSQEAEHSNSKNITLSYFGSKRDRFISIYPAIDMEEILSEQEGNAARWFDHVFEVYEPFVSRDNNPKREVFWTQPYLDRAGNGMMVSCAIPVDGPSGVVGILGADIILNFIDRFTVPIATLAGEMILVSPNQEVISASGLSYDTESDIALLDTFLKSKNDDLMDFSKQPDISNRQDEILFTYALENAPWTLLYIVPKASLNARMFAARVRACLILLIVLLISAASYTFLSRRFMLPAIQAITERNNAEQALRKSEERLELAMTVANDGVWDWHLENDTVFFDSRYYTMAGYIPNEFPSRLEQWEQRIHPDDLQQVLSATEQHLAGEISAYVAEFRFKRKQGDYMWIQAKGQIVSRDETGKPLRFIGTHSNITQRKLAEIQLKETQQLAEAANQSKSDFLANMSHDIRTPMNGIIGLTRIVLETKITPEQRKQLENIQLSASGLLGLLNDILDFSKIEAGQLQIEKKNFSLASMLDTIISMMVHVAKNKGIELITDTGELGLPLFVKGDDLRLRQILMNLVGNSIKFTEEGSVTIKVTRGKREDSHVGLHFVVIDTGVGIPADKQESVFTGFNQGDKSITREFGGTGLGLTICKQLVELMGGEIWIENNTPQGTKFHFTVVLEPGLKENILQPNDIVVDSKIRKLNILLVDDNSINRDIARYLLEKDGHQVVEAQNGLISLELLVGQYFDLILMDIQMPVMNGLTASIIIRASEADDDLSHFNLPQTLPEKLIEQCKGRHIPIVAMTANAMKGDKEKCMAAGMDSYLTKPFEPAQVSALIADIFRSSSD